MHKPEDCDVDDPQECVECSICGMHGNWHKEITSEGDADLCSNCDDLPKCDGCGKKFEFIKLHKPPFDFCHETVSADDWFCGECFKEVKKKLTRKEIQSYT